MNTLADPRHRYAVALVVLAQWMGTSLWFSPSGAAAGLMAQLGIGSSGFAWLLAATQLGFIAGTLTFAATGMADRVAASRIFAASSLLGALANAALVLPGLGFAAVWGLRCAVGLCLAGIYPLGMKMVVQWVGGKPAAALGWLVGMLTLGTALPQGLSAAGTAWPWQGIVAASSVLAVLGGALVYGLGDGPYGAPPTAATARGGSVLQVFRLPGFRAAALGYWGHMWELYAFWSVLPWLCLPVHATLVQRFGAAAPSVALLACGAIAVGCLGCIGGGQWSRRVGSARVAAAALAGSGLVCGLFPLIPADAWAWQVAALGLWGLCVVADSPQFSALSAQHCPPQWLGSALAVQNGIGFLITVVSIVLMGWALPTWGVQAMWLLLPGPALGLWAMRTLLAKNTNQIGR